MRKGYYLSVRCLSTMATIPRQRGLRRTSTCTILSLVVSAARSLLWATEAAIATAVAMLLCRHCGRGCRLHHRHQADVQEAAEAAHARAEACRLHRLRSPPSTAAATSPRRVVRALALKMETTMTTTKKKMVTMRTGPTTMEMATRALAFVLQALGVVAYRNAVRVRTRSLKHGDSAQSSHRRLSSTHLRFGGRRERSSEMTGLRWHC
mmetsp:Transcript_49614/g.129378  ORF Transcript_49614/g.129378 Transcript_49614/m.129378 type:complete len:208 (+) Transcript_49614:660-1283(+)